MVDGIRRITVKFYAWNNVHFLSVDWEDIGNQNLSLNPYQCSDGDMGDPRCVSRYFVPDLSRYGSRFGEAIVRGSCSSWCRSWTWMDTFLSGMSGCLICTSQNRWVYWSWGLKGFTLWPDNCFGLFCFFRRWCNWSLFSWRFSLLSLEVQSLVILWSSNGWMNHPLECCTRMKHSGNQNLERSWLAALYLYFILFTCTWWYLTQVWSRDVEAIDRFHFGGWDSYSFLNYKRKRWKRH